MVIVIVVGRRSCGRSRGRRGCARCIVFLFTSSPVRSTHEPLRLLNKYIPSHIARCMPSTHRHARRLIRGGQSRLGLTSRNNSNFVVRRPRLNLWVANSVAHLTSFKCHESPCPAFHTEGYMRALLAVLPVAKAGDIYSSIAQREDYSYFSTMCSRRAEIVRL